MKTLSSAILLKVDIGQTLLFFFFCLTLISCGKVGSGSTTTTTTTNTTDNPSAFYITDGWGLVADGDIIYAAAGGYYSKTGEPSTTKWVIYKTTDGGTSWTTVDYIFKETSISSNQANSLYVHSAGTILAGGLVSNHWGIRKTTDSAASWVQVDTYSVSIKLNSKIYDINRDSSNNIYAVGTVIDDNTDRHWIVRKSTDSGANWTLVDDYITDEDTASNTTIIGAGAREVVVDGSDNIFVAGTLQKELSDAIVWLVRKSSDGGTSWTNVDEYQYTGNYDCWSKGIDKNSSNHLFVVGTCTTTGDANRWIVRKSTDGGTTWTVVDNYQLKSGISAAANGIRVDASDNIYVIGAASTYGAPYWITRKSTDGGTTWATVDNFELNASRSNFGYRIEVDNSGNIYATGSCGNATLSTGNDWVIRKSTDAGSTWSTVLEHTYSDITN